MLTEQVEALAARQPVLIICEDAHWIDPSTEQLFTLLAERIGRAAVMVLVTYRPDFVPLWTRHTHATQLSLSRLTLRQGAKIIQQIAGGKEMPQEVEEQIVARIEDLRRCSTIYFGVETLEYLQRGGRIGRASALVGSLLSMKPILTVVDGVVEAADRRRTTARAQARLL